LKFLDKILPEALKDNFTSSKYLKMEEIVLSYPKLKDRVNGRVEDRDKAIKNLKEIRAELSTTVFYGVEKFFDTTLAQLYDGFNFNENSIELKNYLNDHNVVLVPNHQSHADYVAINYMFFKKYKTTLYVAGGNNLNIFPIGPIFRKSGCFFIRRSFANDILYKLTLEAYLYYMLIEGNPIEFFFEGGRSRTGKLLQPRFGLYQMLIEAHKEIPLEKRRPLAFVPVSIVHEYVPEQKALARELDGGKKVKENAAQVFGLIRLFSYQFGHIHIALGKPIVIKEVEENLKLQTQRLAFECFTEVGKNMNVTPTSLLAMILLDEPTGALKWEEILQKARAIIQFCKKFQIPFTESLQDENFEKALGRSIDILIGNKKVEVIGTPQSGHVFYAIIEDSRKEILYFKNTVLHHFLVPWIVNMAWVKLFNGQIKNVDDLKKFFFAQRKQLVFEFYLPSIKEFQTKALDIISDAVSKPVESLDVCMELDHKELYQILSRVSPFARVNNYLLEAYYIAGLALIDLYRDQKEGFKLDTYTKKSKEVFEAEKRLKRVIKYPESFSIPLSKSSLQYYAHIKIVESKSGFYQIVDPEKLKLVVEGFEHDLTNQLILNVLT
jgi:glycerol-3-phosphate O-acyltransferase